MNKEDLIEEIAIRKEKVKQYVKKKQTKAQDAMSKKHDKKRNKRTVKFNIGESVSLNIPPIDRVGTDFPRLPCVIRDIRNNGEMHELVSKFGIIDICYRVEDLESYSGSLNFEYLE